MLTRATTSLALLGQAYRVRATTESLAGDLAYTANDVGATLQGLLEQTRDASHFYMGCRFLAIGALTGVLHHKCDEPSETH